MGQLFMPVPGKARMRLLKFCWNMGQTQISKVSLSHCVLSGGARVIILCNIDDISCTPLYYASWQGHIKIAKCLLEFNADPNLQGVSIPIAGLLLFKFMG